MLLCGNTVCDFPQAVRALTRTKRICSTCTPFMPSSIRCHFNWLYIFDEMTNIKGKFDVDLLLRLQESRPV